MRETMLRAELHACAAGTSSLSPHTPAHWHLTVAYTRMCCRRSRGGQREEAARADAGGSRGRGAAGVVQDSRGRGRAPVDGRARCFAHGQASQHDGRARGLQTPAGPSHLFFVAQREQFLACYKTYIYTYKYMFLIHYIRTNTSRRRQGRERRLRQRRARHSRASCS